MSRKKASAQRLGRLGAVGHVPGRHAAEPLEPIIGRPVQRHHLQLRLDQVDEGQEELAVEPAQIEVARRPVRGGDDGHARLEQLREQPRQDHRVGAVVDHHLVEAEQLRLARRSPCATGGIGSPSSFARSARSRSCTSSMNSWKWTRRLGCRRSSRRRGPSAWICRAQRRPTDRRRRGGSRFSAGEPPDHAALCGISASFAASRIEHCHRALPGRDRASARRPRPAPGSARRRSVIGFADGLAQRAGEGGDELVLLNDPALRRRRAAWSRAAARPRRRAAPRSGRGRGSGRGNRA